MIRADIDANETCVWDGPDCTEVVFWDNSGEPWCRCCRDRYRAGAVAAGLNDPERPLQ